MERDEKVFEDLKNNYLNNLRVDMTILSGFIGSTDLLLAIDKVMSDLYKGKSI